MSWLLAIGRAIGAGFDWLLRHPAIAILALLVLHVGGHQLVIDPRLRAARDTAIAERDTARAERDAEVAAHRQTKLNYRAAQDEAARLERERIERVKAEQQEITDEVTTDFRRRLADARARAEQLRDKLARPGEHPAGAPGGEPLPGTSDAAGGSDEAPGDHRLSLHERLIATEQALQLEALIEWNERQARVETNAPAQPAAALPEAGR